MTDRSKDILLAVLLMGIGIAWAWGVWLTVPPAFDPGTVGPRAFPLAFGIILTGLAALLLFHAASRDTGNSGRTAPSGEEIPESRKILWTPALLLLAETCAYGFALEKIGFLLATPLVVLCVMIVNLRIRNPRLLAGMTIGMTVGCWLIFQKVMGIYLASGSWINLG